MLLKQDVDRVVAYAETLPQYEYDNYSVKLTNFPNFVFILTLGDIDLRVHEACIITRGDIDWVEGKAIIVGHGNKQEVVSFSNRSLRACHNLISARAYFDDRTKIRLLILPLISRHDKVGHRKTMPPTARTAGNHL